MLKRVMSRVSVDFFVSQDRKILQRNPSLVYFRKFLIANRFMDKKGEGGEFPSKMFCLTVAKHFVEEPFCAGFQKISDSENLIDKRRGEVSRFSLEIFCLTVPKHFVGEPFCAGFQKFADCEKVYG